MVNFKHIFASIFVLPLFLSGQINKLVEQWNNDKTLKSASIGFCIQNAKTSEVISQYNSYQFLIPASTLKVVTTSAALGILGSNFRYETKLVYSGIFNATTGVLNGDIIIVGSGDPTLQSDCFTKDNFQITDYWASILNEKGIKEIKGKVIGDASCFERTVPGTWIWADIGNYFGTVPCGLSFMDNKFKLYFTSKENGSEAQLIKTIPNYLNTAYQIQTKVMSKGTEDEAYVYGDPFSFKKEIKGTIPPNKNNYEVEASLPDPALLCAEMLYQSLQKAGIKCEKFPEANYFQKNNNEKRELLYTHFSPTLDKIIYHTNLKSNNLYCESLLKTLGKGSVTAGIDLVKSYWQERGLNTEQLYMADGCGLSRANTITPLFQTQLLGKIYRDTSMYRIIKNSLPSAGKNGSMSNIGKGTFIENNLQAKTGYINRARGYCGYLKTKSGNELAFSILFNNYTCSAKEAKLKLEKFLIELAEL